MATPAPVLLPGKSHGHWSLVGYSPWGRKESSTTERLNFQFQAIRRNVTSIVYVLEMSAAISFHQMPQLCLKVFSLE